LVIHENGELCRITETSQEQNIKKKSDTSVASKFSSNFNVDPKVLQPNVLLFFCKKSKNGRNRSAEQTGVVKFRKYQVLVLLSVLFSTSCLDVLLVYFG
jgi:hypothetical protein